ncbi:MAG: hypothetical protein ACF8LL_07230, partial [Phycisphaerales bacterium]
MNSGLGRWVLLGFGPLAAAVLDAALEEGWAPVAVITHPGVSDLDGSSIEDMAKAAGLPVTTANPNSDGGDRKSTR